MLDKIKILHTADLHLDNGFTSNTFPYQKKEDRKKDVLHTFNRIIEIAKQEEVDLLLFSGDLFEHSFVKSHMIEYINNQLISLSNTYVFILPGNHDPYHLSWYYKDFSWGNNIFIFSDEYKKITIEELNVVVSGIGFGYKEEKRPLLESLEREDLNRINILMLHGSDTSLSPVKQSNYLPFDMEDLINSQFDYIALGHYHKYKPFVDIYGNVIATYPGSPEPLGFDEEGKHGIIVGEISKRQNNISFTPISKREYYVLDLDITDCQDIQDIRKKTITTIAPYQPEKNIFLISFTGLYSWKTGISIDFLEEQFKDIAYYIKLKDKTELLIDIDTLVDEDTLLSSFIKEMQKKIQEEKDENQRNILKKALNIGIEALRGGGHKV